MTRFATEIGERPADEIPTTDAYNRRGIAFLPEEGREYFIESLIANTRGCASLIARASRVSQESLDEIRALGEVASPQSAVTFSLLKVIALAGVDPQKEVLKWNDVRDIHQTSIAWHEAQHSADTVSADPALRAIMTMYGHGFDAQAGQTSAMRAEAVTIAEARAELRALAELPLGFALRLCVNLTNSLAAGASPLSAGNLPPDESVPSHLLRLMARDPQRYGLAPLRPNPRPLHPQDLGIEGASDLCVQLYKIATLPGSAARLGQDCAAAMDLERRAVKFS